MFVKSQSYGFDAIAKMDPKNVENDCKNFRLTALTFFLKKNEGVHIGQIMVTLGLFLVLFLKRIQTILMPLHMHIWDSNMA